LIRPQQQQQQKKLFSQKINKTVVKYLLPKTKKDCAPNELALSRKGDI
jgi:hypothetical protein